MNANEARNRTKAASQDALTLACEMIAARADSGDDQIVIRDKTLCTDAVYRGLSALGYTLEAQWSTGIRAVILSIAVKW